MGMEYTAVAELSENLANTTEPVGGVMLYARIFPDFLGCVVFISGVTGKCVPAATPPKYGDPAAVTMI